MANSGFSRSKAYRMPIFMMVGLALILFLTAGSLKYWQAWIYWTLFLAVTIFITEYFFARNPEFLSRRWEHEDQATVRKIPAFLNLFALFYFVAGFDFRFHWSMVPVWLVVVANLVAFLGYLLVAMVFQENSYASGNIAVRQEQAVIKTGPYAVIRHPMYTGMMLMILFAPLALGSYWALLPSFLFIPWVVLRIGNEEELLLKNLPGYRDYCARTVDRLIPWIW